MNAKVKEPKKMTAAQRKAKRERDARYRAKKKEGESAEKRGAEGNGQSNCYVDAAKKNLRKSVAKDGKKGAEVSRTEGGKQPVTKNDLGAAIDVVFAFADKSLAVKTAHDTGFGNGYAVGRKIWYKRGIQLGRLQGTAAVMTAAAIGAAVAKYCF